MNELWIVRFVRKDGKPDEEYFNRYASYHILFDTERIGAMLRVTLCGFRCRVHGCFSGLCAPEIDAFFRRLVQAA